MAETRSRRQLGGELFPGLSEARSHLLRAEKEFLLAVRSILDEVIERTESITKQQKRKTIKKVDIK